MCKTLKQLEAHADALADMFENYEPRDEDRRDSNLYRALESAVRARAQTERTIADAVATVRADGASWATIGSILGTTGQAAQQRYGR